MIRLELLRKRSSWWSHELNKTIPTNGIILETRHNISDLNLNNYFVKEFGEDSNGGITNALSYVEQKYGGGCYQLRIYQQLLREDKYIHSQTFELAGLPKATYISPFSGKVT